MAVKRIPISSVQVGMYLCGIDRSWLDTPFLRHRFLIDSSADIAKLRQCGIQEISIDTELGIDLNDASRSGLPLQDTSAAPPEIHKLSSVSVSPEVERLQNLPSTVQGKSLSGELTSMKHARKYMLDNVQNILQTLGKTGGLDLEHVHCTTQSIMAETLGHEDACIAMIRTREFSPVLYEHALTVSTLAILLGRTLELEEKPLQQLATAALLHDVGLLKIPHTLHRPLNQLTKSEITIYHTHPKRGVEMLAQQSTLTSEVETLIREHHLALDGSGYPSTHDPAAISPSSRILRIVDEYDELLSGHHTGNPVPIRVALQRLYQQGKKGSLDGELVAKFINVIGIYPTYGVVELSTGERGIVTANSRDNLLQPTILLIQDANHRPLPEPIPFNLSVLSSPESRPEIVKILPPEHAGIELNSALEDWLTL